MSGNRFELSDMMPLDDNLLSFDVTNKTSGEIADTISDNFLYLKIKSGKKYTYSDLFELIQTISTSNEQISKLALMFYHMLIEGKFNCYDDEIIEHILDTIYGHKQLSQFVGKLESKIKTKKFKDKMQLVFKYVEIVSDYKQKKRDNTKLDNSIEDLFNKISESLIQFSTFDKDSNHLISIASDIASDSFDEDLDKLDGCILKIKTQISRNIFFFNGIINKIREYIDLNTQRGLIPDLSNFESIVNNLKDLKEITFRLDSKKNSLKSKKQLIEKKLNNAGLFTFGLSGGGISLVDNSDTYLGGDFDDIDPFKFSWESSEISKVDSKKVNPRKSVPNDNWFDVEYPEVNKTKVKNIIDPSTEINFPRRINTISEIGSEGAVQKPLGRASKWTNLPRAINRHNLVSLRLAERTTCPNYCEKWLDCVGNDLGQRRIKPNDKLLKSIENQIKSFGTIKKDRTFIHLHELGDFFSVDYVKFWESMLDKYHYIALFGSTRRNPTSDPIGVEIQKIKEKFGKRFDIKFE